jgi:hypothetical protein
MVLDAHESVPLSVYQRDKVRYIQAGVVMPVQTSGPTYQPLSSFCGKCLVRIKIACEPRVGAIDPTGKKLRRGGGGGGGVWGGGGGGWVF